MHVHPKIVTGLDIETDGSGADSYISSVSMASFMVTDLSLVNQYDYIIGLNDSLQANRVREERVLDWWRGLGNNAHTNLGGKPNDFPQRKAYEILQRGNGNLMDALIGLDSYLYEMNRKYGLSLGEHVLVCKGPDFDPVILQHARKELGVRFYMPARMLDSARTMERISTCLQLPKVNKEALGRLTPYGEFIEHVSLCDALYEGFEAARNYNILTKIPSLGLDELIPVAPHEQAL